MEDLKKIWGIIGLGWLGQQLAAELKTRGQGYWGTHRQEFDFATDPFPPHFCDIIFLNTPPLVQLSPLDYARKIPNDLNTRIIFISSTSVYGGETGPISESTPVAPLTDRARWLVAVELALRNRFAERLIVVRPGGLIGADRHPICSLVKKGFVVDGDHRVNLIHAEDLIEIILKLESLKEIQILNAVSPYHPRKRDYYSDWAKKIGESVPEFSDSTSEDRIILSDILPQLYPEWKCPQLDRM